MLGHTPLNKMLGALEAWRQERPAGGTALVAGTDVQLCTLLGALRVKGPPRIQVEVVAPRDQVEFLISKGHMAYPFDFLDFSPVDTRYDGVLMATPVDPDAARYWIAHGWDLLREGGLLLAVAPEGIIQDANPLWIFLRGLISEMGAIEAADAGTVFVTLRKT